MQTIKEKTAEIVEKQTYGIFEEPVHEAINEIVEFMQRWIPFTEELPPLDSRVLLKGEYVTEVRRITYRFFGTLNGEHKLYTSWRLIEF